VVDVDVPEIESGDHLRAPVGEIDADLLRVLEAADFVATKTTVPANETFTGVQKLLLRWHRVQPLLRDLIRQTRAEELERDLIESRGIRLGHELTLERFVA
jgi:hypothetical protein